MPLSPTAKERADVLPDSESAMHQYDGAEIIYKPTTITTTHISLL